MTVADGSRSLNNYGKSPISKKPDLCHLHPFAVDAMPVALNHLVQA